MLEFVCRSVSGLKDEEFILEMGTPFGLSVVDHHRSFIATLDLLPDSRQLWLVSLAMCRRQETEFSRM